MLYPSSTQCSTNPKVNASTYIGFTCAKDTNGKPRIGVLGTPKYLSTDNNCTSYFIWTTSAACPVSSVTSETCGVTVPDTGDYISLLPLAQLGDVTVTAKNYSFALSICQPLHSSKCQGAGVCQSPLAGDWSKNLGVANSNVTYADGIIKMRYSGGDVCGSTHSPRMTEILFKCDVNAGTGAPVFVSEMSTCVYQFLWKTSAACAPSKPLECTAYDDSTKHSYDLSSLSTATHNWIAVGIEFVAY